MLFGDVSTALTRVASIWVQIFFGISEHWRQKGMLNLLGRAFSTRGGEDAFLWMTPN